MCLLPLLLGTAAANAQPRQSDTLEMKVYFRKGSSEVDPSYRENAARLEAFRTQLSALLADTAAVVRYVSVRTSASPDGNTDTNRRLSDERARKLERLLQQTLPLDPLLFHYQSAGEDWESLAAIVRTLEMPWRDEALYIIGHTPQWIVRDGRVVDGRKRQLKLLRGGEAWRWLEREVFPELRAAGGHVRCVVYHPVREVPVPRDTLFVERVVRDTVYQDRPAVAPVRNSPGLTGREVRAAVRTNALAVPFANLGIELPLGEHWSVGADWYYPWIWRPQHGKGLDYSGACTELLALGLELHYWLPDRRKTSRQRLLGHAIGLYAAAGYYDFERDWSGYQGKFANVGADFLYACPVFGGRMHLEFGLGIGCIYSPAQPYDTFVQGGKAFRRSGVTRQVRWFGPTRAQISIVVPIYGSKGGGVR